MIGKSIVMFGGFDGEFFNDLHVLPLQSIYQDRFPKFESTINEDFSNLIKDAEITRDQPNHQK